MSRTIITERDVVPQGYVADMQGNIVPEPTEDKGAGGDYYGPPLGGGPLDYAPGPLWPYSAAIDLKRGYEKEAELRNQIEEAIRDGDEIRESTLSEIRADLIKQLTLQDLQSIYEEEASLPETVYQEEVLSQADEEEPSPTQVPATMSSPSPSSGIDGYTSRLLKYIPAESVALYLTLQGIIVSGRGDNPPNSWLWLILGVGIVGTPIYLARIAGVRKVIQLAVSTIAFGIWVFALGGAFASLSWYEPFIGSLALVIFTFFAPLISPDSEMDS
jgi:hypothetical protein